jgi:hypothetical protein
MRLGAMSQFRHLNYSNLCHAAGTDDDDELGLERMYCNSWQMAVVCRHQIKCQEKMRFLFFFTFFKLNAQFLFF